MSLVGLLQCPARHLSMCPSVGEETLCQVAIIVSDECSGIICEENNGCLSDRKYFVSMKKFSNWDVREGGGAHEDFCCHWPMALWQGRSAVRGAAAAVQLPLAMPLIRAGLGGGGGAPTSRLTAKTSAPSAHTASGRVCRLFTSSTFSRFGGLCLRGNNWELRVEELRVEEW